MSFAIMNPLTITNDSVPNFMGKNIEELPNFTRNLCLHLRQIILKDSNYSQLEKGKTVAKSVNLEQRLKNALNKKRTDAEDETGLLITIDELVPFFVEECHQNFVQIDSCFASYYLHLLIRDSQDGLKLNAPSKCLSLCKLEQFLLTALAKYKNPTDTTVCCLKISFYCKNSTQWALNFVKEKYELNFNNKLKQLTNSILQYPENSSGKQLEEMFLKIQVFIITNYQIGYPENHVLLKQCRQSLNSILGKGDIQKYVLKKKYHRLEYLQKLAATAAGILIFNNQGPEGDRDNVRNVFDDLKMANCNTKDSFHESFDRVLHLKQKASEAILELVQINVQQQTIHCLRPLIQIRELNKFVVLFEVYIKKLDELKALFEKTQYLEEVGQKKFNCVIEKINEILKYRSAIESELIFPHFVYLSEIWNSFVLYLNHLVEINKVKDHLDHLLGEQLEAKFNEIYNNLSDKTKYVKHPLIYSFQEAFNSTAKYETKLNMLNIKPFIKDYCALTMTLTGGFLVPSRLEKKLCENVDFRFGFASMEYAKYFERHFKEITQIFRITVLTCSDLIVLFEMDEEVMQQDFDLIKQTQAKSKTLNTQTELNVPNKSLSKNQIETTWNIWDFHRQTIKLADIRKRQTHSTQSNLTYGLRNAQNQSDIKLNNATQK